jgi:hypothetical protein
MFAWLDVNAFEFFTSCTSSCLIAFVLVLFALVAFDALFTCLLCSIVLVLSSSSDSVRSIVSRTAFRCDDDEDDEEDEAEDDDEDED